MAAAITLRIDALEPVGGEALAQGLQGRSSRDLAVPGAGVNVLILRRSGLPLRPCVSEEGPHADRRRARVYRSIKTWKRLRSHRLALTSKCGIIALNGSVHVAALAEALTGPDASKPQPVVSLGHMLLAPIAALGDQIMLLERELRERARRDDTDWRLMTIPGIGVISATAIEALAPPSASFAKGRDFAAWRGLTPRQNSTGGKVRLGSTAKK